MRLLHIGCGPLDHGNDNALPDWAEGCDETRLDIDPNNKPHIVANMLEMGDIGGFDIVYSSHTLEHVYPHEVVPALQEQFRVLRDGGAAVVVVPDLEGVLATEDVVYESLSGPITGLDMIYGKASFVAHSPHMAHHSGFTQHTLSAALKTAGFSNITTKRLCNSLMAIGQKGALHDPNV